MRVVALISGGKDSCFNVMQCIAAGHDVVALANLQPHARTEIDSYMYQSVGHEAIELIAQSMELPLFRQDTAGTSHRKELHYSPTANDEVEDLYTLLQKVQANVDVEGVSVGAILSDYQRIRVENVCLRLGLTPLAYLWQRDQRELLKEMIESDIDAVIIKVAALGLEPSRHLGRSLRLVQPHLEAMYEKYGLNVCGEGGEYETLVLDCPLFSSRLIIEESEVILHSNDAIAPVGFLKLNRLKLERKLPELDLQSRLSQIHLKDSDGYITDHGEEANEFIKNDESEEPAENDVGEVEPPINNYEFSHPAHCIKSVQGWLWLGGITEETENAEEAMWAILKKLKCSLEANNHRLEDVCSVNLFIRDMGAFAALNAIYVSVLDHVNPPSRACVQVPLPKSCPIILEALSWSPNTISGDWPLERHTLHVQSISHWAPANIGPYSQAVRIGDLIHMAGQIGFVPGSMQIVKGGIKHQCQLALRHIGRVLNVMDPNINLRDVVQGICYLTDIKYVACARKLWEGKTNNAIVNYVIVTNLPRNALVEWHVWAHKHNNQFEYEETGKCIEDWSVSIYRRWNYENNIATVVCHIDNCKEDNQRLPGAICDEMLQYAIQKLQQGHEHDTRSVCNLKIFYAIRKEIALDGLLSALNNLDQSLTVAYTLVPVLDLHNEHTFLSVCGIRIQ